MTMWRGLRRPTYQQPVEELRGLFPTLSFHVTPSMRVEGCWYLYITTKQGRYVGTFWDKMDGFPSDVLLAKLALVA